MRGYVIRFCRTLEFFFICEFISLELFCFPNEECLFLFVKVKVRTSNHNTYSIGSHVMLYGNESMKTELLYLYQGFDPATDKLPENKFNLDIRMGAINQRDADLLFLWQRVNSNFNYKIRHEECNTKLFYWIWISHSILRGNACSTKDHRLRQRKMKFSRSLHRQCSTELT